MIFLDAQLSPHLANWITENFNLPAYSASFKGMIQSSDLEIFNYARQNNFIVITKDEDFVKLLDRHGPPSKIIWLTCGNSSNNYLKQLFSFKKPLNY
jgi:predicted nuclease of predicted toxin-antitoxin system